MIPPTAAEVRVWSRIDFGSLDYADNTQLQVLVDRAVAFIEWATGRPMATVPVGFEKLVQQAVQYKTEHLAYQDQPDLVETAADFMLLSSFTAGRYTETRRSLTELKDARMIDADPRLNGLLWSLLTDDMRDFWMGFFSGENSPAFSITEVDWSGQLLPSVLAGGAIYVPSDEYGIWPN